MDNICRISSDSHALPSFHCSRLAHNPSFCDHLSVGPAGARLSRQTALLINNASTQIFWRKHGLKIWKSASSEITNFASVVESGMERLCISSLYWDKPFEGNRGLRLSAWFKRKLITGVTSSGLKGQMNSLVGLTDLERRIPAAGGENAAMETSYRPSVEPADIQIPLEKDSASATASAGVLCPSITTVGMSTNIVWHECMVEKEERQKHLGQQGCVVWITGLSGSGKSTLACTLDHALLKRGNLSYVLDGDNVRHGLNSNLGFSADDRAENIRRIGEVAKLFVDAGFICIVSVISPYRKDRDACRQLLKAGEFIEVYMNFPLDLCEERDPKGLYKLARAGKIKGFTGVDDPYEAPLNCEVVMEPTDGKCPTPAEMAAQLVFYLEENCVMKAMV